MLGPINVYCNGRMAGGGKRYSRNGNMVGLLWSMFYCAFSYVNKTVGKEILSLSHGGLMV